MLTLITSCAGSGTILMPSPPPLLLPSMQSQHKNTVVYTNTKDWRKRRSNHISAIKQKHFLEQEYVLLYATHLASQVLQPNEDMFQVSMVAEYYHVRYTLESGFALEVSF